MFSHAVWWTWPSGLIYDKNIGFRVRFFLLSPSDHVFHKAWIKSYIISSLLIHSAFLLQPIMSFISSLHADNPRWYHNDVTWESWPLKSLPTLFNHLLKLTTKKTPTCCIADPFATEFHRGFPYYKGPRMLRAFPWHDVIMYHDTTH